jgi:hypothetical protein
MRLSSNSLRAVVAAGVSLWIGVLACVMGCALPAVASAESRDLVRTPGAAAQRDASPMAGMENCPHHSGSKVPGKPGKSPGGSLPGRMSCCPPEVTVAPKSHFYVLAIVVVASFVVASPLPLSASGFSCFVAFVPPVIHSGRDTLLETRLLRI